MVMTKTATDDPIRYALAACSLGQVLVAASGHGVRAIMLHEDTAFLVADLERRFPGVLLVEAPGEMATLIDRVVEQIETPTADFQLALDPRGTDFQQRVWQALCEVPLGETASYADIAARIGSPGAVRAVAQACGANHISVAIPCHRIVRAGGGLGGYHWGVARKRALLAREARAVQAGPIDLFD